MSGYDELLAAVKDVRDRTGDPNAWQKGLAPDEVAAVLNPTTRPDHVAEILRKIRQPQVAASPPVSPPAGAEPGHEQGQAAEAIARAEAALAQQNSSSSQLDMQVVSAILNAHLQAIDGRDALIRLQRETETAVQSRSDLDTPAGARDFQRFLIGKLRDIRAVVLNASLDDTSKSALMAAWTSLYDASKGDRDTATGHPVADGVVAPADGTAGATPEDLDAEWDPLLDSLLGDDVAADDPGWAPSSAAGPPPLPPAAPAMPAFGAGSLPGFGGLPASGAGWEPAGGLPFDAALGDDRPAVEDVDDDTPADADQADLPEDRDEDPAAPSDEDAAMPDETLPVGPTPVALPDGETVTAASPQLAAAIKAAVAGAPIAEAFQQQGLTLPPPGTPVANPIEPARLAPGDIGIFTDRHTVALGPEKALLDGQIQHISTVSGPSFLGWEHPPAPAAPATAPAKPDAPTPTRPATSSTT
ncbi:MULTISPECIES: DUF4226 domain-containing protein [unclassified Mycobacterium]|uniref:DUF4226 domain-containing protein n=1 Tax=unclassified Mycobacterium TaxID=2642494 RepID=UPI0007FD6994|nr:MULTISPECIES: DUF4226 domain-containing protein [unclassified Mycobacterium]OBG77907.1 hypothetical protein A5700_18280 [Mycobacterium sp. E1214]OBH26174.1 hypothetical protein A5693_04765 [Mycobacterium sp. E1319]